MSRITFEEPTIHQVRMLAAEASTGEGYACLNLMMTGKGVPADDDDIATLAIYFGPALEHPVADKWKAYVAALVAAINAVPRPLP